MCVCVGGCPSPCVVCQVTSLVTTLVCDVTALGHKSLNAGDVKVHILISLLPHSSTGHIHWVGITTPGRSRRNKQFAEVLQNISYRKCLAVLTHLEYRMLINILPLSGQ